MRHPRFPEEGRNTAVAFVTVLAMFVAVAWAAVPTEPVSTEPIVATSAGDQDCVARAREGEEDMKVESVSWSRGAMIVDASHYFTKGAYQPVNPKYSVSGKHVHIGWTWSLPQDLEDAGCRARHRIHLEIRGLKQGRYALHLEPIVSMR